ncbi:MAG: lipoprotein [Hyphomicrobiales bacterium]
MRLALALLIAITLTLGACGIRGPLEAPPGATPQKNDPFKLDPLL